MVYTTFHGNLGKVNRFLLANLFGMMVHISSFIFINSIGLFQHMNIEKFLIKLCFIILFLMPVGMLGNMIFEAYAKDRCLDSGYTYAQTTITGDIYCYGKQSTYFNMKKL